MGPVPFEAVDGLVLLGEFIGVRVDESGRSQIVFRQRRGQGDPIERNVIADMAEYETGRPTRLAARLDAVKPGDRVFIRVQSKVTRAKNGTWLLAYDIGKDVETAEVTEPAAV